jgi:hypothetical protein
MSKKYRVTWLLDKVKVCWVLCFMPSGCVWLIKKETREGGQKHKHLEKFLQTGEEPFDKHQRLQVGRGIQAQEGW